MSLDVFEDGAFGGRGVGVGAFDLRQQPRLRVHLADEVVHRDELGRVLVDDELDALVEGRQCRIGDDARDLDDRVALDVEAGHLEVDPDQSVVDVPARHRRHAIGRAGRSDKVGHHEAAG